MIIWDVLFEFSFIFEDIFELSLKWIELELISFGLKFEFILLMLKNFKLFL